jgi:hypothetical protein
MINAHGGSQTAVMRYPLAMPALTILSTSYLRVAALASHILVVLLALGSVLAVLRLTTSSKVVGCWTGRSAGFAPLRILPT